jgi:D-3-phosphoglycerate dehydrogenase / 2-oxoglutarate reductase
MLKKILIVDKADPVLAENLERAGFLCETILDISGQQFINLKDEYIGLIIRSKFAIDKIIISSKPQLKFIVRLGAGMEHIDINYASQKGIVCISTPEGNAPAVAQHALAFLLSTLRHIQESNIEVRKGIWNREKNKGKEISSLTIGIVGFGNTGKAFVDLLAPFHPKILVYDKYKSGIIYKNIVEVTLDELLKNSDVLSIHINYIPENKYFFNCSIFQKLRKGVILINTSRGSVLNTKDLIESIKQKKIIHACLDVLEYENVNLQIPSQEKWDKEFLELCKSEQVTITPHIAGQTPESELRHAQIAFQKIIEVMKS